MSIAPIARKWMVMSGAMRRTVLLKARITRGRVHSICQCPWGVLMPRHVCLMFWCSGKAGGESSCQTVSRWTLYPCSQASAFILSMRMRSSPPAVEICSMTYRSFKEGEKKRIICKKSLKDSEYSAERGVPGIEDSYLKHYEQ